MTKILSILMLTLLLSPAAFAQECGPNCPVCSGAGSDAGALLTPNALMISGLSIPTADEETTVLGTRYGVLSWLDVGLGYAVDTKKVLWSARTQPVLEQEGGWKPGVILGIGSVQTGGSDQSVYAQFIKSVELDETYGLRLSAGVATLSPDFDELFSLAGITGSFKERYAIFANYDGKSYHEGVSWIPSDRMTLSFLLVESEYPAFSIVFRR